MRGFAPDDVHGGGLIYQCSTPYAPLSAANAAGQRVRSPGCALQSDSRSLAAPGTTLPCHLEPLACARGRLLEASAIRLNLAPQPAVPPCSTKRRKPRG